MITVIPDAIPLITPVVVPTEAIPDALLDHVPPVVTSLNVPTLPIHKWVKPVIDAGDPLTVIVMKALPQLVV